MNIRVDKDGFLKVYCHACKQELDAGHISVIDDINKKGDLQRVGNSYFCIFCHSHLGYLWDIEEFKQYAGK